MRERILIGCITLLFIFGLTGCDWTTEGHYKTGDEYTYDLSGDYVVNSGDLPFGDIMIWQTGNTLRAQDSRGDFWEGTVGGAGGELGWNWQIYLQCQNQKTGLTEIIRGRAMPMTITIMVGEEEKEIERVVFEGIYSRSDNTSEWFEMYAYVNWSQWPSFAPDAGNGDGQ